MAKSNSPTVVAIASEFHDYGLHPERAEALALEVQTYLATIDRKASLVTFDDAPADFDAVLRSYAR